MKKIVCMIDSLCAGGAQRQLTTLGISLKNAGYEVSFLVYHDIPFFRPELERNGIDCTVIKDNGRLSKFLRIFRIAHVIRRISPDVVVSYLHSPNVIACLLKMFGMKFRLVVSDRNTTLSVGAGERLMYSVYRLADVIVPNSDTQTEFIKKNFPALTQKVRTIHNFVDTDYFCPDGRIRREGVTRIICVGRLEPQKNVERFLEALAVVKASFKDFRVDWYGKRFDYYRPYENKIGALHLEDVFFLHDPVSDLLEKYRDSDALCLPSIFEGYPNVLCEAMSCGIPVLCSDVCDNPTIVRDGIDGLLFDPYDVSSIADALLRFLNLDREQVQNMGGMCRVRSLELFDRKAILEKYISVVEGKI